MKYIYLLILFLLIFSTVSSAQIIQPGRPTQAYGTAPVPKGLVQLETGTSLNIQDSSSTWNLNQTTLRYGIAKNFDAYTAINLSKNSKYDGDISVGLRYRLINKKIKLTYWASAAIPLFPNVVSTTHVLALEHSVSKKVAFGYSIAYEYDFNQFQELNYRGSLNASYLVNVNLMDKLSCFFGINARWDVQYNKIKVLYDAGLTYLIKDNLQVDLFWGHGINYKDGLYGLGISWLILKDKK